MGEARIKRIIRLLFELQRNYVEGRVTIGPYPSPQKLDHLGDLGFEEVGNFNLDDPNIVEAVQERLEDNHALFIAHPPDMSPAGKYHVYSAFWG